MAMNKRETTIQVVMTLQDTTANENRPWPQGGF